MTSVPMKMQRAGKIFGMACFFGFFLLTGIAALLFAHKLFGETPEQAALEAEFLKCKGKKVSECTALATPSTPRPRVTEDGWIRVSRLGLIFDLEIHQGVIDRVLVMRT